MINVLIVDDSAVVRRTLKEILASDKDINVIGAATDPFRAVELIAKQVPDVITLDIEMPRMDGLTFLRKVMSQRPIPIVVISSLTDQGSKTGLKALEYGAIEIITKPRLDSKEFLAESKIRIIDAVKAAAVSKLRRISRPVNVEVSQKYSADVILSKGRINESLIETTEKIIAIGASTGGTEAISRILRDLPQDCPGILIVQHMPEIFTRSFAERLDRECKISVKEASKGDSVLRGRALIAPGNHHMLLKRSGAKYFVDVVDGPLVNRHRPSVDVLFRSVARYAGKNSTGIILTGMGDDGAKGLLEMHDAGAKTIAQDEKTCIVFGMPKEAVKLDAVDIILPLEKIPLVIVGNHKINKYI